MSDASIFMQLNGLIEAHHATVSTLAFLTISFLVSLVRKDYKLQSG